MNSFLSISIQLVVVLLILYFLNFIALKIMVREDIVDDNANEKSVTIFRGWVDTASFTNKKFVTNNPFAKNYRKLSPSMNRKGGVQFSYSFWLKLNNTAPENLSNKVLFVRGDPTKYPYTYKEYEKNISGSSQIVKCPLFRFGDQGENKKFVIECNTVQSFDAKTECWSDDRLDETVRRNVTSLMGGKWTLLTIVFEDYTNYGEKYEQNTKVSLYINYTKFHTDTQSLGSAIRTNDGPLVILPNEGIKDGYMSDLTYHNFALSDEDIRRLYNKGFTNERFNEFDHDLEFNQPLYLNQYNKLEIYNL